MNDSPLAEIQARLQQQIMDITAEQKLKDEINHDIRIVAGEIEQLKLAAVSTLEMGQRRLQGEV